MKKTKKAFYIILLLLLMMQSGGLFVALKLQQYATKARMLHKLSLSETKTEHLRLLRSDYFKSITDKKEILFAGNLFDIKSIDFTSDSVDLIVIRDEVEGNILDKIKVLFDDQNHTSKKTPRELIQLMTLDYLQCSFHEFTAIFINGVITKTSFQEGVILRNNEVFLPPPEKS
jgi:hypothetical protein